MQALIFMLVELTYVMATNISTHVPTYLLFIVEQKPKKQTLMTLEPATNQKTTPYHHGDLRTALIDASVDLVAKVGADAFTLKDASRIAGVSVAAPYRHFTDKSELLHEVTERAFQMMAADMKMASQGLEPGTLQSITAQGQAYVRFAAKNPALFRLMCDNHGTPPGLNVEALFQQHQAGAGSAGIIDLLDIDSPDVMPKTMAENPPNQGIACFSILLKGVAKFLDNHGLDVGETLAVATPMWSIVHGTAFLLIDQKFEHLTPTIDTNEMVATTTRYYLSGLLQEKTHS